MVSIYTREGNGLRLDRSKLEPIITRLELKVDAICAPEYESHYRWRDAIRSIRTSADIKLLAAYEQFISAEHSDPRMIDEFVYVLRGRSIGGRFYRSLSTLTHEHLRAYWSVREAVADHALDHGGRSGLRDDQSFFRLVIADPDRATNMIAIIKRRGPVEAKVMLGLLSSVDNSAPMLVDGAL